MTPIRSIPLLAAGTVAATGTPYDGPWSASRTAGVQATIDGTGAVSATVTIQGSNDGVHWTTIGSALSLSGTTTDSKAATIAVPWAQIRAVSSALSGTGATVACNLAL